MRGFHRSIVFAFSLLSFTGTPADLVAAEMSSPSYIMPVSVLDSSGTEMFSPGFQLLAVMGQATPIGFSGSDSSLGQAGFLYQTDFTLSVKHAAANTIGGLQALLDHPGITLTRQEVKCLELALKFLDEAIEGYARFEAGDDFALANTLNKVKSAIKKLLAVGIDTTAYQKMLAQSAELAVSSALNRIRAVAGPDQPCVLQAQIFFAEGASELVRAEYHLAVQSFVQAYNEVLSAG